MYDYLKIEDARKLQKRVILVGIYVQLAKLAFFLMAGTALLIWAIAS